MFHVNDLVPPEGAKETAGQAQRSDIALAEGKAEKPHYQLKRLDNVSFVARLSPQGRLQATSVKLCDEASYVHPMRQHTSDTILLDEVKLLATQLNAADLSEMAFFVTQMLMSKLRT